MGSVVSLTLVTIVKKAASWLYDGSGDGGVLIIDVKERDMRSASIMRFLPKLLKIINIMTS